MTVVATSLAFGIMGLGAGEITLIVLVLIFFFGAKRIPEIARGLGKSVSEFKKGKNETPAKDTDEQA
jgi:sec-independent protein translocase protein TatA